MFSMNDKTSMGGTAAESILYELPYGAGLEEDD